MSAEKLLKELIKNELWGGILSLSSLDKKDFSDLQRIASMQTVSGLVFSSLINNNIKLPQQEALAAFGSLENIKKSNLLLNSNLILLTELLEKHDIKFFIVKGQTIANLYPHPLHRIGGDIDFYCFPNDLEKLINILHSRPLKTIFQHKACTDKLYADSFYKVQKNSHSSFEVICCGS